MWILLEEESALQTSVDGTHLHLLTEESLISRLGALEQCRVRVWCPTRIAIRVNNLTTSRYECALDVELSILLGTLQRGALRCGYHNLILAELHRGEVCRGLDQARHSSRHSQHTRRNTNQSQEQVALCLLAKYCGWSINLLKLNLSTLLNQSKLCAESLGKGLCIGHKLLCLCAWYTQDDVGLAWNGVAEISAIEVCELSTEQSCATLCDTRCQLVGVGVSLVDIVTRVTTQKTTYAHLVEGVVAWALLGHKRQVGQCVDTSRTTDKDLALILRVEVDEVLALHHTLAEVECSCEASLLVYRKECLECWMCYALVDEQSQGCCYSYTVVCSKSCAIGLHPFAIDDGLDSVVVEVEHLVRVLLAYHIGMGLKHDGRARLVACGCRLADDNIAYGITLVVEVVCLGKIDEELRNLLLLLRWARYSRDVIEDIPN